MATENMKRSDVLIIIPAYNEAANIEQVVDNIIKNYSQYDYVVINDGSTDDTMKRCLLKNYNVIDLQQNLGIGGAVQTGYKYAGKMGYEYAVQMDGDGQHDPKFLKDMIQIISEGRAEAVIGSRFIKKEGFQSSSTRRFGIGFLSGLGFLLTGQRVKDITSGYRLISRQLIDIYSKDYPSDYPEPEAFVVAAINGCRIEEYPVIMCERLSGSSSINLKRSVYYMIKVTLAMLIRRLSLGFRRAKKK